MHVALRVATSSFRLRYVSTKTSTRINLPNTTKMRTRSASKTRPGNAKQPKRKHEDPEDPVLDDKVTEAPTRRKAPRKTLSSADEKASKKSSISKKDDGDTAIPEVKMETKGEHQLDYLSAQKLSDKKFAAWSQHAHSSPYPNFLHPTPEECQVAYDILEKLHGDVIREVFADPDAPAQEYPYVMDALVVAALSQATSWTNAKRAMKNMKAIYGSTFNYDAIVEGGMAKLVDALRPGGMQNRKSKILMQLLNDVKERHGKWDLQFLFNASDEEVVKEVVSYWGLGPKCAFCLMSICLNRDAFAVDTHIYRIAGLWGWRPREASREMTQAHLDAQIPNELKFGLHYQLIVHGQKCPVCRGNGDSKGTCEYRSLRNERKAVNGASCSKE
ncbi:base excision DNA repair protein [Dactylonectria estremocensis]|uniref:Base excision DNA repair protein n=1 Tax=Dactylonectria estremocensis TaxID=1079267 RepID=A0A9P9EUH7_9HYPO|nr:base excision DNA repair protein [Dactylonectria estremocensis]